MHQLDIDTRYFSFKAIELFAVKNADTRFSDYTYSCQTK